MNFETFKDLTRIEQTLFALPFVIGGALMAVLAYPFSGYSLIWILPAFLMARISGMSFNQLIDRKFDARNPRTKNRAIPSGRVSAKQARVVAITSLILFIVICWKINFLCFLLSPVAAFLLVIYSYMKRIHASCHFVVAIIHFLAPVMAFIALSGTCSWGVIFLGLVSCMSIAGNDIAYAIQDLDFDRENKLHSIPSKLGIEKSLLISRILHAACLVCLVLTGIYAKLPFIYYGAILVVGFVFYHFHITLHNQYKKTNSVSGIESVFFFVSVAVAFSTFLFIVASFLWDVLL